jgi:hypothetical protein
MNTLPNELLLKVFNRIPWESHLKYPLNLVCKKWDNLIQRYEIDFNTDYNTSLHINVKKVIWFEIYSIKNKKILIKIEHSKNYDKK